MAVPRQRLTFIVSLAAAPAVRLALASCTSSGYPIAELSAELTADGKVVSHYTLSGVFTDAQAAKLRAAIEGRSVKGLTHWESGDTKLKDSMGLRPKEQE